MYLFFDTETTGLPKNWRAPVSDLDNWPRLIQLAFLLYDRDGTRINSGDYIIKPEGFIIPSECIKVHGITTERVIKEGKSLKSLLIEFYSIIEEADTLVAHNMSFDEKIVGAEFLRISFPNILDLKRKICNMESTINFCAIPGQYGYKRPKLSELHQKLFNTGFEEQHNAAIDIQATARCFWELRKLVKI